MSTKKVCKKLYQVVLLNLNVTESEGSLYKVVK